jgi:hypothetical protein
LVLAVRQLFRLTPTEVRLLLALIQHPMVIKPTTDDKIIGVHMHYMRKRLAPFGIAISSPTRTAARTWTEMWLDRRQAGRILQRVAGPPRKNRPRLLS